jgi:hypothetical protein
MVEAPAQAAHDVEVGAAMGVAHALAVLLRADALQRARHAHTRLRQPDRLQRGRLLGLRRPEPQMLREPEGRGAPFRR